MRVGVFDSGLGGLTIVQAILKVLKGSEIIYVADTLHAPYGEKSTQEILDFSLTITRYLIERHQIDALVVACNTATSAAIETLRNTFLDLIIIGTEPAIKPAIEQTNRGNIGVLATPATLKGDKYQSLVDRVASSKEVRLYEQACPGLVEHIERDSLRSDESITLLESWLHPMRESDVDIIVLGCTHYPLASDVIREVMGREVILIESGEAIANYLLMQLQKNGHQNRGRVKIDLYYTGEINAEIVHKILGKQPNLTYLDLSKG
jgi:glutamate racemase